MDKFSVSVIIPVYNMERYIVGCIKSVLSQTLKNIEIIVVDDGSIDNTIQVVEDNFEEEITSGKIKIKEQTNSGPGKARNNGINAASGEFAVFMDADDFYASDDALEKLYDAAKHNNVNMCGGGMSAFFEGGRISNNMKSGMRFSQPKMVLSEEYNNNGGFTRFIYNREWLVDKKIYFPDLVIYEDPVFFTHALGEVKQFYTLPIDVYCYRKAYKKTIFNKKISRDYMEGLLESLQYAEKYSLNEIKRMLIRDCAGDRDAAVMYNALSYNDVDITDIYKKIYQILSNYTDRLLNYNDALEYVDGVENRQKDFLRTLKSFNKVYLYGAGTVGGQVFEYLKKHDIDVDAFLVSSLNTKENRFKNVPVYEAFQTSDDSIVLITTYTYAQDDIEKNIQKIGIPNYKRLNVTDFYLFEGNGIR